MTNTFSFEGVKQSIRDAQRKNNPLCGWGEDFPDKLAPKELSRAIFAGTHIAQLAAALK